MNIQYEVFIICTLQHIKNGAGIMYSIHWEMTKSHIVAESQESRQNLEHRGTDRRITEFEHNAQWI